MANYRAKNFRRLVSIAKWLAILLGIKVLIGIVYQYQWYFPADFESSAFLTGRKSYFYGLYSVAFYLHLIVGPIILVVAAILMWSGQRMRGLPIHRKLGKLQFFLVVMVLAPTGIVMATRAHTGMVAGMGFGTLSVATAFTSIVAVAEIRSGRLEKHRQWASRNFVLLASPVFLRITSGFVITLGMESEFTYQFSAWACWMIPLFVHEIWMRKTMLGQIRQFDRFNHA